MFFSLSSFLFFFLCRALLYDDFSHTRECTRPHTHTYTPDTMRSHVRYVSFWLALKNTSSENEPDFVFTLHKFSFSHLFGRLPIYEVYIDREHRDWMEWVMSSNVCLNDNQHLFGCFCCLCCCCCSSSSSLFVFINITRTFISLACLLTATFFSLFRNGYKCTNEIQDPECRLHTLIYSFYIVYLQFEYQP